MVAIDRRIGWIFVGFLVLLAAAVARAAYLGVIQAPALQRAAVSQQITNELIPATRGTITDRNGVELALSETADNVIADPALIRTSKEQPMPLAEKLAPILQLPVLSVYATLTRPHTGYAMVATQVTPAAAQQGRELCI